MSVGEALSKGNVRHDWAISQVTINVLNAEAYFTPIVASYPCGVVLEALVIIPALFTKL